MSRGPVLYVFLSTIFFFRAVFNVLVQFLSLILTWFTSRI